MATTGERASDPYRGFRFRVVIDGITEAGFREVSGLDAGTDIVEYRLSTELPKMRKLPGLQKFSNITLKRGMTNDKNLWEWRTKVIEGDMKGARHDGQIVLIDDEGKDAAEWKFEQGWCAKWIASPFNAASNEVMIDTIEIAHEGVQRVK